MSTYQLLGALSTILVTLVSVGGAVTAAVVSARANGRAAKMANSIERRRADRDDFDSITRELKYALERVETDLEEAEGTVKTLHQTSSEERAGWRRERAKLRRRVQQLEKILRDLDVAIPPEEP